MLIHCAGGRDRTGLVIAMLLQLAGVPEDQIVDDYARSVVAMNDYFAASESPREPAKDAQSLAAWLDSTAGELRRFLRGFDTEGYLLDHGLPAADIERVRRRLR